MLPKLVTPIYSLTLPSNGVQITYRPFLVKEEKIMLIARESQDPDEIKSAIETVVTNCVITPRDFNVKEAATYDVEWILINLRIKSLGGNIKQEFRCTSLLDDETICSEPFSIEIDLEKIETKKNDISSEIWLTDEVGIKMRSPRFGNMKPLETEDFDFALSKEAVEYIFTKDGTVTKTDETPDPELQEFFDSMTLPQWEKIAEYLSSLPKFEVNHKHTCPKCKNVHEVRVDDLQNFF